MKLTFSPGDFFKRAAKPAEKEKHRVSLQRAVYLRTAVLVVSWISGIALFALSILSIVIGQLSRSSSVLAFALDALLDTISSGVVIWRYSGSAKNLYSVRRESLACIVLGVLFLIFATTITVKAGLAIAHHDKLEHVEVIFYLALVDGIVCTSFVAAKVYLGYKLESRVLITDAFNSIVGAIIAVTMMVHIKLSESKYWLMDPVVGLICAVALCAYGLWIIIDGARVLRHEKNKQPIQELCNKASAEVTPPQTQETVESKK